MTDKNFYYPFEIFSTPVEKKKQLKFTHSATNLNKPIERMFNILRTAHVNKLNYAEHFTTIVRDGTYAEEIKHGP